MASQRGASGAGRGPTPPPLPSYPPPSQSRSSGSGMDAATASGGGSSSAPEDDGRFDSSKLVEQVDEGSAKDDLLATPSRKLRGMQDHVNLFDEAEQLFRDHLDAARPVTLRAQEEYFLVSTSWVNALKQSLSRFEREHAAKSAQPQPPPEPGLGKPRSSSRRSSTGGAWAQLGDDAFWSPVDNSDLVERYTKWGAELRTGLVEIDKYLLVPAGVWRSLMDLFGGGPELSRQAGGEAGHVLVDVRGVNVRAVHSRNLECYKRANFSKYATMDEVLREFCRRFDVRDVRDARLWTFDDQDRLAEVFEGDKVHRTLLDVDAVPEQLMLFEERMDDGLWELDPAEMAATAASAGGGGGAGSARSSATGGRRGSFDVGYGYGYGARTQRVVAPGRIGLYNLRNSCYMNSTLQCLSNVPPLRAFFVGEDFLSDLNEDNPLGTNGALARAFSGLMRDLWLPGPRPPRAVYPDKFKRVLDDVHPDFQGFLQHDSQELLSYLLDDLHEDVNRVRKKEMTAPVESNGRADAVVAAEARAVYAKRNESRVSDLCTGMLMSKVACPVAGCRNVSATFDPFMMLPLPVEAAPERFRTVEVTVVPHGSPLLRRVVRARTLTKGPLVLLRNAVGRAAGIDAHALLLADVADHRIVRILQDNSAADTVSPTSEIYAFEDPRASKHTQMLHGVFQLWLRPTLASTGNRLVVDRNFLPGSRDALRDEDDRVGRAYAVASGAPVTPRPPLPGLDLVRIHDNDADGTVEVTVLTGDGTTDGSGSGGGGGAVTPALAALRAEAALAGSADASPFRRGQMWLGHFEEAGFAASRQAVRFEVVHVLRLPSGACRVWAMIDIHHVYLRGRGNFEQEARLVVGEYLPAALAAANPRRGKGETAADKNARRAREGADAAGGGAESGSAATGAQAAAGGQRKSVSRFSPKSLFSRGGARATSEQKQPGERALKKGAERRSAGSGVASGVAGGVRAALRRSSGRGAGAGADGQSGGGTAGGRGGSESSSGSSGGTGGGSGGNGPAAKKAKSKAERDAEEAAELFMGEATLDAGGWRALFDTYVDEPSYLKRATEFRCRGHVDANGVAFFGKVIVGDGSGSNFSSDASNTMDFFLRLAPPEQQAQVNARPVEEQEAMSVMQRKLLLNHTRGLRFASRLAGALPAERPREVGPGRVAYPGVPRYTSVLDPGVFVMDEDATDAAVHAHALAYFARAYNDCRGREKQLPLTPTVRARVRALPVALTAQEVAAGVKILRAGKNYALDDAVGDDLAGSDLDPRSDTPFFESRSSFLRIMLEWEPTHPVVELCAAMDEQLLADGRGSLARDRKNLNVGDCMELLCKSETLGAHDSWFCDKCKTHSEATKTLQVWSFPHVLILHLKRFSQQPDGEFTDKLPNQIDFPLEGLDLRRFAQDPESKLHAQYDLCAVSSHYGGMGSGHYTAYARNEEDGVWYEFDDDVVIPVRIKAQISSNAAYVLFYLRRDLRPEGWGAPGEQENKADADEEVERIV